MPEAVAAAADDGAAGAGERDDRPVGLPEAGRDVHGGGCVLGPGDAFDLDEGGADAGGGIGDGPSGGEPSELVGLPGVEEHGVAHEGAFLGFDDPVADDPRPGAMSAGTAPTLRSPG